MDGLVVTRSNFKSMRQSYGIKLKDVSEKCGISEGCINSFENSTGAYTETNTRDYNKQTICRALQELIEAKIVNAFDTPKKEEKMTSQKGRMAKARENQLAAGIPTDIFQSNIKKYCKTNGITISEFCKMCGISEQVLYNKNTSVVYERTYTKVLNATGWTKDELLNGEFTLAKKDSEPVVKKEEQQSFASDKKFNKKCIMQGGKYYIEYDILQHVSKEISKEEFLKEVSG